MVKSKISSKNSAPGIKIANASLTYQHHPLFSKLNVELPSGKCTCLLGPSGVGKTSLLRLIAGLDSGAQIAAEISTSDNLPLKNRIAYMGQTDALLPWLNAIDNVCIGLRLRSEKIISAHHDRAKTLLIAVGLNTAINKKPSELSGGMRQRVALARTLFEDKPVVLMDEPFAALDAITKWRLQTLTANLLKDKTVLLITHDPLEALRLAHYIYVISGNPAKISEELLLADPPPRDLQHPLMATWQSKLIEQLQKAQACVE
jgi:putative hydroxymethylpyrimidine transport system ATP-binding protein